MPQESPYQLESLSYSAKLGLYLLVAAHDITTSNLPVAGTTTVTATGTNGLKLPTAGRPHSSYDNYIYTHLSPAATAGYFRLNFVDTFPTTPLVMEDIDPVWGKVRTHTYVALTSSAIPDVADEFITGRYVLRVGEQQLSGDVCIVTVTTVGALTVSQTDSPVDMESGESYTRTKTWTLAATQPAGAGIGADGVYTTVEQLSHRLWLSTTQPSSFVPVLEGGDIATLSGAKSWSTTDAIYWPPVLKSYQFDSVMSQMDIDLEDSRYELMFTPKLRDGYSGPVKCLVKEWWQATAPTAVERPEMDELPMIPVAINFPGRLQKFSVQACLHGEVVFSEPNSLGTIISVNYNVTVLTGAGLVNRTWTAEATIPTDWPETVVIFKSQPSNGGWRCEQRTYYRPDITGGDIVVSDEDFVLAEHGWRDPPLTGTLVT